jgi:hypothetical protein
MTKPNIAIVLRTVGLEYDDRVRKECIALSKIANLKIFVTFENNAEEEGYTSYGIPYKSFKLTTRERIPSGKLLLVKAFEFYLKVKPYLKEFDLIWAHEEYTFLFPLFAPKGKFVWDLHEIPAMFTKPIMKNFFNYIENKSKAIIHANPQRIKYLIENAYIKYPVKHSSIRNFPDNNFLDSNVLPNNYTEFKEWLGDKDYVYLQGLTVADRFPYNSIASVLDATDLNIVVVGTFEDIEALESLRNKYGEELNRRVFFAGRVNQLAIPAFLRDAKFSIVLYNIDDPNNRYCEANRFYQAINYGIPVIVGCNESMADIMNDYNVGIALKSDGRDLDDLKNSIISLQAQYDFYKNNATKHGSRFLWDETSLNIRQYVE